MFELFLPDLDLSFLFCGLALTDFSLHTVWSRTFISPAKYLWGNNLEFFRSSGYLYLFISSCSLHCLCCWLSMSCVSLSPVRCSSIIYGVFVNLQAVSGNVWCVPMELSCILTAGECHRASRGHCSLSAIPPPFSWLVMAVLQTGLWLTISISKCGLFHVSEICRIRPDQVVFFPL